MDKFLQGFKDNLERQTAPEFDEQDWVDMEQRLELHHQTYTKPNYWVWAAVALLLLMVGSNSLIFRKLSQANEQINHLEASIDSLTQTRIIVRTDTIYQIVEDQTINKFSSHVARREESIVSNNNHISQKGIFANPFTFNSLKEIPKLTFIQDIQKGHLVSPFSENIFESIPLQKTLPTSITNGFENRSSFGQQKMLANEVSDAAQKVEGQTATYALLSPIEQPKPSFLKTTTPPLPERSFAIVKQKKSIGQILYPMRPKGIEIGLAYGLGMSLKNHHKDQKMQQWAITTQIKFSEAFRWWIAGDYWSLDYESKRMGAQYGVPELAPPSDNFEFDETNIDQGILSISAGLQYHFRALNKWQPFIGIGYGWSTMTRNRMEYRFTETGVTNFDASEQKAVVYEKARNLPFGILKGGILYQWNDRFSFQLEGAYLHRVEDFNNQLPNILMGNVGTSFSF